MPKKVAPYSTEVVAQTAATSALQTALVRLLAFEPDRYNFAEMDDIPAPDYDGRALRLALYFSLSDVASRVTL